MRAFRVVSPRVPRSAHLSLAPVQTYPTRDGWIFIMCMTQKFWLSLVDAMGCKELANDPRFPDPNTRAANRAELDDALDPVFKTRTTDEWLAKFNGLLPAAPVYRLDQALDSINGSPSSLNTTSPSYNALSSPDVSIASRPLSRRTPRTSRRR